MSHQSHDLSSLPWTLRGWHPHIWRLTISMELGMALLPDIEPMPVTVPGSVQKALRAAGKLPDWNVALNSRDCEWVENRHWHYQTTLPADWTKAPGRKILRCEGLDYQGVVYVNAKQAGSFIGTFTPHAFDLTEHLKEGENTLSIIFTDNPRSLGQAGYTSQISEWKTRFNFIWDWCPRLVQVGIWDKISLEIDPVLADVTARTTFDAAKNLGSVTVSGKAGESAKNIEIILSGQGSEIASNVSVRGGGAFEETVENVRVQPWHPNGNGAQPLYTLKIRALGESGKPVHEETRTVGFKQIEWKQCQDAPAGADPWICSVNGVDTFLQGINWVPLLPHYADVPEERYRKTLQNYRDIGLNIIRVWGGAVLEKEIFYRLCDEMGILVWQEFPFSSSGVENWPPEDPKVIDEAEQIARSYVKRRQHHASLLLWCGGNELQGALDGGKQGIGKPIDRSHPMMVRLGSVVEELDPGRRFIPTSSTGPRFMADAKDYGKGLHHDVHGPWNQSGPIEEWFKYWDGDDSLFRSETGMPGAASVEVIRSYAGDRAMPASETNPLWVHTSSWWFQWKDYLREGGKPDDLTQYVTWSQKRQADALGYAAAVSKKRFPKMGGIILWMGHDCFPCPINTSIFDYTSKPKPAALAVGKVFKTPAAQLK